MFKQRKVGEINYRLEMAIMVCLEVRRGLSIISDPKIQVSESEWEIIEWFHLSIK
jgi:hypothetical protein